MIDDERNSETTAAVQASLTQAYPQVWLNRRCAPCASCWMTHGATLGIFSCGLALWLAGACVEPLSSVMYARIRSCVCYSRGLEGKLLLDMCTKHMLAQVRHVLQVYMGAYTQIGTEKKRWKPTQTHHLVETLL
jgi:hypothetical protein